MSPNKLAAVCLVCALLFHMPFRDAAAQAPTRAQNGATRVEFVDVTARAGINWAIRSLAPGLRNVLDTMGGGGGFLDYNGDGLLDIYLVCYTQTAQPGTKLRDALYRNNGDGTFTDVTEQAGLGAAGMQGMGLAVGDYDNDGRPDIYVTGYGASRLYHNQGNGTFADVTQKAGVDNKAWGASAAFFDYDNDGRLDLFAANYLRFDPADASTPCNMIENRPYCAIARFKGTPSRLFRNRGDGTFQDVSEKAGISSQTGKGLGVVALDYNNDGRADIFQANDAAANFLFRNQGDGTFKEVALESGVAYDPDGNARGGMGVDAADLDGDGYLEIFVANFTGETYALFHNNGDETFNEVTEEAGLGRRHPLSGLVSGFGARFLDFDNDGAQDLFVLNGHPFEPIQKVFPRISFAEPPLLFEGAGKSFRDVTAEHGAPLRRNYAGRGLATGDFDNDGDTDVLLMNVGEPPVLLRNDGGNARHWLGIKLVGTKSNRDGVGAKVTVTAGGARTWKPLLGGTSYCSASDTRLLFGLGASERADVVEVRWPSGQVSALKNVRADQYITVREGEGQPARP
jgi:hypothetical protein